MVWNPEGGNKMGKIFKIVLIAYCFLVVQVLLAGCSKDNSARDGQKIYVPQNKETPEIKETGKPEGTGEFKGVEWTKEDEEKYAIYHGSLDICADRDNGGAYYVNWGYDNYLYYWKDGKRKLVLDKWVSQICYMDGMVYCIYDKTGSTYDYNITPSYEGIICSVNVKTGEFKELLPVKAKELAVCKEGLYYYWLTGPDAEGQKREGGFYSFGSQEVSKIDDFQENGVSQERYGKYAVVYREGGCCLKNLENGSEQPFIYENENEEVAFIHICAGRCYYRVLDGDSRKGYVMNLKNGETHRIGSPISSYYLVQLNEDTDFLYTITGGGSITVYNPVKDTYKDVDIKNAYSSTHHNYIIEEIFSDGRYLYAIAGNGIDRTGIVGFVVLKPDGKEISEVWSSLEYDNKKNKR